VNPNADFGIYSSPPFLREELRRVRAGASSSADESSSEREADEDDFDALFPSVPSSVAATFFE
jgi:hypothetical protein